MTRILLLSVMVLTRAATANAQTPHFAFPAAAPGIAVTKDVQYGMSGSTALAMDIYRPAGSKGMRMPALVFFNRATGAERSGEFYAGWARTAASKGIVAILPDLRDGSEAADFGILAAYLSQHSAELGLQAIAVYAGSGNVYAAFPAVEDARQTGVAAAVMYYGSAPIAQFRLDLPVLYVRAGLDRPETNRSIIALASRAAEKNAPVSLLNYSGGHHGFEMADDNDATRLVIDQTLEFVKSVTAASYQAALRATLAESVAAGYVQTGKFHEAAAAYAQMLTTNGADPRLRLSYGEALLGDGEYATACAEFDKLKTAGLGYRDLGLPAARACLLKGDQDAAIAWLKSIPSRFLPASIEKDPAFAPLQNRPDFRALFASR
jgi:dienelactone hydrolase